MCIDPKDLLIKLHDNAIQTMNMLENALIGALLQEHPDSDIERLDPLHVDYLTSQGKVDNDEIVSENREIAKDLGGYIAVGLLEAVKCLLADYKPASEEDRKVLLNVLCGLNHMTGFSLEHEEELYELILAVMNRTNDNPVV